jgi:hypothetical protein
MPPEANLVLEALLGPYGVVVLLLLFVVGLQKEWWVMGGQYRTVKDLLESARQNADLKSELLQKAIDATNEAFRELKRKAVRE